MGENNYKMRIENPKIWEMLLSSWWCIRLEEVTDALLVTNMEETSNLTRIFLLQFSGDITKYVDFKLEN